MLTYNEVKRLLAEKYNSEMAKEKIRRRKNTRTQATATI